MEQANNVSCIRSNMRFTDKLNLFLIVLISIRLFMFDVPGLTPVLDIKSEATVDINTSASGNTLLVSHSSNNVIRFSYHLLANGLTSVSLVYGTQTSTACDTGTTTIDGPYTLIAQTGMTGIDMIVPTGNDLCINNSNAIQVGGALSYLKHGQ